MIEEDNYTHTMKVVITENGPYLVSGDVPLDEKIITPEAGHYVYTEGRFLPQKETYALCRCGKSKNPPFCDGAHIVTKFDGTETASRTPFEKRAHVIPGQEINLLDDKRCALARFCHRDEGDVWQLTKESFDPHLCEEAIIAASECPAGRLVQYDKKGNVLEPELAPGITILQDPQKGVSAGIYVKGRIPLESADGTDYELRNRYVLCRCGSSKNKPFCDATHAHIHFEA